eukprot:11938-Heterococcus_DN1.PRE.2
MTFQLLPLGQIQAAALQYARGGAPSWWPFHPKKPSASLNPMNKIRKVPVKVEPKVFFSNERTFIA